MKAKLKIFYVTPEVSPFAHTTDLADVASAFPKYLKTEGHDIRVMMPNYRGVNERKYVLRDVIRLKGLKIKVGEEVFDANGKSAFIPNSKVQIYFLDNRKLFDRDNSYEDMNSGDAEQQNARRFVFFAFGCLETLKLLYWQPDIIHCNDWQTAIIPFLLKTKYKDDPFFKNTKTLFSVHNPEFHGLFDASVGQLTGVGDEVSSNGNLAENGNFSFLQLGVNFADQCNTTGPARDSDTSAMNKKTLATLNKAVLIQNGVDSQIWDPQNDKLIHANYSAKNLEGKSQNKKQLLERFGLREENRTLLIAAILNPIQEDGAQLLLDSMNGLLDLGVNIIIAGKTSDELAARFKSFQEKHSDRIGLKLGADDKLIHLVEAGSDLALVLTQTASRRLDIIYSQMYGTIPVVCAATEKPVVERVDVKKGSGTGYVFDESSVKALLSVLKDVISCYEKKEVWDKVVQNAMNQDFSWEEAGQPYLKLYAKLINNKGSKK